LWHRCSFFLSFLTSSIVSSLLALSYSCICYFNCIGGDIFLVSRTRAWRLAVRLLGKVSNRSRMSDIVCAFGQFIDFDEELRIEFFEPFSLN
jgi:hypothetical protein